MPSPLRHAARWLPLPMALAVEGCFFGVDDLAEAETICAGQSNPEAIIVQGGSIFWNHDQGVSQRDLSASECTPTLHPAAGGSPFAVDDSGLFIGDGLQIVTGSGTLVTGTATAIGGVALDAVKVFWTESGAGASSPDIGCAPKDGGDPAAAFQLDKDAFAGLGPMVVDGTDVYAGSLDPNGVVKVSKSAPHVPDLTASAPVTFLAMDDDRVYWTAQSSVHVASKSAWGSTTVVASNEDSPRGLAVDDGSIYWSTGDGRIMRVDKAGGSPMVIVDGLADPRGVAVDDEYVYWASRSEGSVSRIAK